MKYIIELQMLDESWERSWSFPDEYETINEAQHLLATTDGHYTYRVVPFLGNPQARINTLLKMAVGLDEADLELIWTYFPNLLPEAKRECLGEVKYVMEDPEEQQETDEE